MRISALGLLLLGGHTVSVLAAPVTMPAGVVGTAPPLPVGPPQPAPTYTKNNINNINGVAPDKRVRNGPVLDPEPSPPVPVKSGRIAAAAANDYWLASLGPLSAAQSVRSRFSAEGDYIDNLPGTPGGGPTPVPLTRGPIKCHNEKDFPGHEDINPADQDDFSFRFSSLRIEDTVFPGDDDTMGPDSPPIRYRRTDRHGINYEFTCEWVAGCVTTVARQSFGFSSGDGPVFNHGVSAGEGGLYQVCGQWGRGRGLSGGVFEVYVYGRISLGGLAAGCEGVDCRGCETPFDPAGCQSCCQGRTVASSSFAAAAVGGEFGSGNVTGNGSGNITVTEDGWIIVPEDLEKVQEEQDGSQDEQEDSEHPGIDGGVDVATNGTVFIPAGEVGEGGKWGPAVVPVEAESS